MRVFKLLILSVLLSSFLFQKEESSFNSILIGKKINETPLQEYITEEVKDDQLILLIAYGCSHCMEATEKTMKLKTKGLIDDFIVLGSEAGETDTKKKFVAHFGPVPAFKIMDYDWSTFPGKFTHAEKGFPNPPVIFYVHKNVIKKIVTEVPGEMAFKKIKEKIR